MPERNGAQLLVECLQEAGVTAAFGMAGHTNIALLDALVDSTIQFYSVRHEQVAAYAADAYFRVNRRPAALILHVGPGVANAMTWFGDAMADGSAIVAIAGDVASFHQGKDAFQEVGLHADAGQWEIARPLTKWAWKITSIEGLLRHVSTAIRLSQVGRPGPVLVSVAMDVFSAQTSRVCPTPSVLSATMAGTGTHASIVQATAMLGAAAWVRSAAPGLPPPTARLIARGMAARSAATCSAGGRRAIESLSPGWLQTGSQLTDRRGSTEKRR